MKTTYQDLEFIFGNRLNTLSVEVLNEILETDDVMEMHHILLNYETIGNQNVE